MAYDLSIQEVAAVIVCERFSLLPESLRNLVDIRLKLPNVDASVFEELFTRVIGQAPPADWRGTDDSWIKYLIPSDFEHPYRMKVDGKSALEYIRDQVRERLASIDPGEGVDLDQLYGLGEARQFAEDLIADIHAAMEGKIPWSRVDAGALFAGPPGTGKTTLARAIAKACGVKFIQASASTWMANSEHLGNHIRNIRSTFSEARRYAPSILFIDEIDSIGNRERISDRNNDYMTAVVNAVLEQIQGVNPEAPVFVLGATNHEDAIDPALKRSGRLDRVIQIPRPNAESLRQIYRYYIRSETAASAVADAIDTGRIGGLSIGLTGADVARIVRGALRRARRDGRPLEERDLIAELTGKARVNEGTVVLTEEELERVAWHEAGHALAAGLSSTKGADIGFVTVIPRGDGALGFVARTPDERKNLLTRKDYIEWIELCLAGRAAEQLRYGESEVSGGASGDLQTATGIAVRMSSQLGLGPNQKLVWSESPTREGLQQAESMLGDAYDAILLKLTDKKASLEKLAAALMKKQELSGGEVREIVKG
jgi:ATP-dependent Zn protease